MGVRIDGSGRSLNSFQPCFLAYLSATAVAVTGNGANYQVAFDTKVFDQGSNFTTGAAALFTAPVTGKYLLAAAVQAQFNANAVAQYVVSIIATSRTIENQLFQNAALNSALTTILSTAIIDMTAGDTAYVNAMIGSTGSNTCNILGQGSPYVTYFSGCLIC